MQPAKLAAEDAGMSKRQAVSAWTQKLSDSEIARHVGVSDQMVMDWRERLSSKDWKMRPQVRTIKETAKALGRGPNSLDTNG